MLSMEIRTSVLAQVTGIDLRTKGDDHRTSLPTATIGLDDVLDGLESLADGGSRPMRLASDTVGQVPEVSGPVGRRSVAAIQRDMGYLFTSLGTARICVLDS